MKALENILKRLEHYLADKRQIAVGQHYKIAELRASKDYVTSWRRSTGETLHYDIAGERHKVEMWQEPTGYYECLSIRGREGKSVDSIEVRL